MAKSNLNSKSAVSEIETILAKIENDELDVDQLSKSVKRVAELIKFCKDKLHNTEQEVQQIIENMDENE